MDSHSSSLMQVAQGANPQNISLVNSLTKLDFWNIIQVFSLIFFPYFESRSHAYPNALGFVLHFYLEQFRVLVDAA